jgi:hypothetical protein
MMQLADQCLSKLTSETDDMIRFAFSQNSTLQQLLGLKDDKPPGRLISLVVNTLAACLSPGLWTQLERTINHPISLRLIRAMLDCPQVKGEETERIRIKSEIASVGDEHASFGLHE